jgi:hypothetical protein
MKFVDMMINNLNCKVVNHIPQKKKSMNMYSLFIWTFENVELIYKAGYDKFCMCYGAESMWLFVYYPCNIVECVI